MHQTELRPSVPQLNNDNNERTKEQQLQELERTMQSLAVNASAGVVQQQKEKDGGVQVQHPSPSYEGERATSEMNNTRKSRPNKPKKCLQLNLNSISNCQLDAAINSTERVLSPWQQLPRRVHRPSKLFPVHILPYLFLGNVETAENQEIMEKNGIRYVINVTSDLPNYFEQKNGQEQFTYLRVPVDDNSSCNLAQYFPEAISFIETARSQHAGVLVHCWAGISRSVTVCLAYLMYALQCTLEEAFDRLLSQNGTIAPNFHFMEALTCWERELRSCGYSHSAMGIHLPPPLPAGIAKNGFLHHHHNGTTLMSGGTNDAPIVGKMPLSPSAAFNGAIPHSPAPVTAAAP